MWEMRVWFLGWEDPLEEGMATHSNILAWKIPMDREAWWVQSMESQRVGLDWVTKHSALCYLLGYHCKFCKCFPAFWAIKWVHWKKLWQQVEGAAERPFKPRVLSRIGLKQPCAKTEGPVRWGREGFPLSCLYSCKWRHICTWKIAGMWMGAGSLMLSRMSVWPQV